MIKNRNCIDLQNLSIGIVLWILIIIPFLLPIIIPLFILRHLIHFLAKIYQHDLISMENVADSVMTFIPSRSNPTMNAAQIWKVQGKLEVVDFRQHFYKCFLSTEELRQKYRNLYCYFVEWMFYCFKKPVETIILEDHIREYSLGKGVTLEDFVGEWMTHGIYGSDSDCVNDCDNKANWERPSWEILIVYDHYNHNETESVLLFKIHHGLCDGYTFVHLVEKLTGIKSPYHFKEKKLSFVKKLKICITFPKLWLEYHFKNILTKDMLYPRKQKDPKWFISFTTLNLDVVKKIRRSSSTHFNSVLISAFVGALQRHFLASMTFSEISKLPKFTWVGSALGWPNHPAMTTGGMTNHMTIGGFRVPLKDDDLKKRLSFVNEDYKLYHNLGMNKLIYWTLFHFLWVLPASFVRFAGKYDNFGFLRFTTYVSPLMCSNNPYELMGLPVKHLYLPLLTSSLSMYTSMYVVPVSRSGIIDLSINASSEIVKDQEELNRFTQVYFQEELNKMTKSFE